MWSGDKAFAQNLDQRAGAGFAAADRELYTPHKTLRKASKVPRRASMGSAIAS